jgi:hypothetical protein
MDRSGKSKGGGSHKERLFLTTDLNKRRRRQPFIVEDARKRVPRSVSRFDLRDRGLELRHLHES